MARHFAAADQIATTFKVLQPPFTIGLWANTPTNSNNFDGFIDGATTGSILIDLSSIANRFRFLRKNQAVLCTTTNGVVGTGWTHMAVTHSGTAQQCYINGVADGTAGTDNAAVANSAAGYVFGNDVGTQNLNGSEADVAFWSVVLSAAELLALGKGARPYTIRQSKLIGWWPLDGLQSPEPDLSGSANNGTLTATTKTFGPPYLPFTPRWPQFLSPSVAVASLVFSQQTITIPLLMTVPITVTAHG